jgi:hypothetical protein
MPPLLHRRDLFILFVLAGASQLQAAPSDVFVAVPGVTVDMEKDFLTKYKAAIHHQDVAAYVALYPSNAAMPKSASDFLPIALAMDEAIPAPAYAFAAITPGQHNPPSQLDGKTYVDDRPAVIELKVTSTAPAASSAQENGPMGSNKLLGLENNRLVFIGCKEDAHAVVPPPPAPMPAPPNFGFKPNVRQLTDQQQSDDDTSFKSMDDFLAGVQQPGLQLLASGTSDLEYCALYRLKPNLLVCAEGSRPGQKNYGFQFSAKDANGGDLACKPRWIALVDHQVDNGPVHDVTGYVFEVPPNYHGPLAVKCSYTDDSGKELPPFAMTVDWK